VPRVRSLPKLNGNVASANSLSQFDDGPEAKAVSRLAERRGEGEGRGAAGVILECGCVRAGSSNRIIDRIVAILLLKFIISE
jgi:hypothetical protein